MKLTYMYPENQFYSNFVFKVVNKFKTLKKNNNVTQES